MNTDKLINKLSELTNEFVASGKLSYRYKGGIYEIHLKHYHISRYDSFNIFTITELQRFKYEMYGKKRISGMMAANEYPLNLRTLYKKDGTLHLLTDTEMFLNELLDRDTLKHYIEQDKKVIEAIHEGVAVIND